MSADNGYIVAKVDDRNNEWGIFHYFASNDREPTYTHERAIATYSNPVHTILAAHKLERDSYTEYGVSVSAQVLEDTHHYFDYNTNEIEKWRPDA